MPELHDLRLTAVRTVRTVSWNTRFPRSRHAFRKARADAVDRRGRRPFAGKTGESSPEVRPPTFVESSRLTFHEEHPGVRRRMTTRGPDALLRRALGARHYPARARARSRPISTGDRLSVRERPRDMLRNSRSEGDRKVREYARRRLNDRSSFARNPDLSISRCRTLVSWLAYASRRGPALRATCSGMMRRAVFERSTRAHSVLVPGRERAEASGGAAPRRARRTERNDHRKKWPGANDGMNAGVGKGTDAWKW